MTALFCRAKVGDRWGRPKDSPGEDDDESDTDRSDDELRDNMTDRQPRPWRPGPPVSFWGHLGRVAY